MLKDMKESARKGGKGKGKEEKECEVRMGRGISLK